MVATTFTPKLLDINSGLTSGKKKDKVAEIIKLSPISVCLLKEVLEKFFSKDKSSTSKANLNTRKSYVQVTNPKVLDIIKLKENYPNLLAREIENIHKFINNMSMSKLKPYIKMTIKRLSHKQVIILMSKDNIDKIMALSSVYITNTNRALKNIKSKIMVDYICSESIGITIVSNSMASSSDLQIIENYINNIENITLENIPRLPQSKSYLKIIRVSYFINNTNISISLEFIESVIKSNHIFNNLSLASKPRVIKAFSKSDMAVIWIDIWNAQSGKNTKMLINRYFNIGRHIVTIYSTNINPGIL